MSDKIKFKKGLKANLPTLPLATPGFVTDEDRLYIGGLNGNVPMAKKSETDSLASSLAEMAINVSKFGAKGDGVSDDTQAFQDAINYCILNNATLTADSKKKYLITAPLIINKTLYADFNNATIVCSSGIEYCIYINCITHKYGGINNLKIECNSIAKCGVFIEYCSNFNLNNVDIFNFTDYGIYLKNGYEFICNNINFKNLNINTAYGIYCATADCHFTDIIIVNCKVAVCVTGGLNYFTRVHGWIAIGEMLPDSVFFDVQNSVVLTSCVNDTYYIGYRMTGANTAILIGCRNFYNKDYYNPTYITVAPYVFYYLQANGGSSKTYCYGMITSNAIQISEPTHFSNLTPNNFQMNYNLKENNRFADNIDNIPDGTHTAELTISSGWVADINKITVKNNRAIIDLKVYCSSITSGAIYVATIPTLYQPKQGFIVSAIQGGAWDFSTNIYCYIGGTQIQIKINDTSKGNYIHLHCEYDI